MRKTYSYSLAVRMAVFVGTNLPGRLFYSAMRERGTANFFKETDNPCSASMLEAAQPAAAKDIGVAPHMSGLSLQNLPLSDEAALTGNASVLCEYLTRQSQAGHLHPDWSGVRKGN